MRRGGCDRLKRASRHHRARGACAHIEKWPRGAADKASEACRLPSAETPHQPKQYRAEHAVSSHAVPMHMLSFASPPADPEQNDYGPMGESGRKIPDPYPLMHCSIGGHGTLPPAAVRSESTVTTGARLAERSGTQSERAQVAAGGGPIQVLGANQKPLCGSREQLGLRPDCRARPGSDSMALSATRGKPAWQGGGEPFDPIHVVCDDGPDRV